MASWVTTKVTRLSTWLPVETADKPEVEPKRPLPEGLLRRKRLQHQRTQNGQHEKASFGKMRPWVKSVLSFFKRIFPFAHNSIEFFQRLDGARCILLGNAVQIREQLREVVRIVLLGKRLPALGEKQIGHAAIFSGYLFSQIPFCAPSLLRYGSHRGGAGSVYR